MAEILKFSSSYGFRMILSFMLSWAAEMHYWISFGLNISHVVPDMI